MENRFEPYFKALKKELCCPREMRNGFLEQARQMAENCLEDFPDASYSTLKEHLGSPCELASILMEGADPAVLAQYRHRKQLCKRIAFAILAIIVLLAVALSIYYIYIGLDATVTKESVLIIHEGGLMEKFNIF